MPGPYDPTGFLSYDPQESVQISFGGAAQPFPLGLAGGVGQAAPNPLLNPGLNGPRGNKIDGGDTGNNALYKMALAGGNQAPPPPVRANTPAFMPGYGIAAAGAYFAQNPGAATPINMRPAPIPGGGPTFGGSGIDPLTGRPSQAPYSVNGSTNYRRQPGGNLANNPLALGGWNTWPVGPQGLPAGGQARAPVAGGQARAPVAGGGGIPSNYRNAWGQPVPAPFQGPFFGPQPPAQGPPPGGMGGGGGAWGPAMGGDIPPWAGGPDNYGLGGLPSFPGIGAPSGPGPTGMPGGPGGSAAPGYPTGFASTPGPSGASPAPPTGAFGLSPYLPPAFRGAASPSPVDINALLAQYQGASNSARGANEQRYAQVLQGYQDLQRQMGANGGEVARGLEGMMNAQNQANQALLAGYEGRYARNMDDIRMLGQTQRQAIEDAAIRQRDSAQQDLITRGLGNTTVVDSVRRGIESDRVRNQTNLEETLARLRIGTDSALSGDTLQARERGDALSRGLHSGLVNYQDLQSQRSLGMSGDMLNFIERRQDTGPDAGFYLGLIQSAGAQNQAAANQQAYNAWLDQLDAYNRQYQGQAAAAANQAAGMFSRPMGEVDQAGYDRGIAQYGPQGGWFW